MGKKMPRVVIAGLSSGSGKTLISCGLIKAFYNRGLKVRGFKCGPDYIDPMFLSRVLGVKSRNLDTYFAGREGVRELFGRTAGKADISVIEGVMGYYDGLAGKSAEGSTYDIAAALKAPVILVVNPKGSSVSMAAMVKGMVNFREDSRIEGIIFNQISQSCYEAMKELTEKETAVKVLGFVPKLSEWGFESRHLGLVKPDEVKELNEKVEQIAGVMEQTVDLDQILEAAEQAPLIALKRDKDRIENIQELTKIGKNRENQDKGQHKITQTHGKKVKIAVARDKAFDFYYEENLELLMEAGGELVYFSPLEDTKLPEGVSGLILGGGYPELYAKELSDNKSMRKSIKESLNDGMPCLAECGGFMYLHDELETSEGKTFPLCGVIKGRTEPGGGLKRFGYIELEALKGSVLGNRGTRIKGHEFHYWESDNSGNGMWAKKPLGNRAWQAVTLTSRLGAGFPHLYYPDNPEIPCHFIKTANQYEASKEAERRWDSIAKPIKSLGRLEDFITKLAFIKGRAEGLALHKKALVIMCADHGVVEEGVTQTDSSVTRIVSENFAKGASCVNYMAETAGVDVYTIDIGMDTEPYPETKLVTGQVINRKIRRGSRNIKLMPAMTEEELRKALEIGIETAGALKEAGYDLIATGEMGIGNTTPSSALTAELLKLPSGKVTGRGAGLSDGGLEKKQMVVEESLNRLHNEYGNAPIPPIKVLAQLGGFDIAGMAGLFLGGVIHGIPIIIDGAISGAAALAAACLDSRVLDYAIASHAPKETMGNLILEALGLKTVLCCDMCLGEGSGAIGAVPLFTMAAAVYKNMSTFTDNGISQYEKYTQRAEDKDRTKQKEQTECEAGRL